MAWMLPFFLESYTHCHSSPSTEPAYYFPGSCSYYTQISPPFTLNVSEYCCSSYLPVNGNFTHPRWILVLACTFRQTYDKQSDGRKALLSWLRPLPQSYNQHGNKCYLSFHSFLMKRKWRLYSVFKPSSLCLACRQLSNLPSLKSSEEKGTIYCQVDPGFDTFHFWFPQTSLPHSWPERVSSRLFQNVLCLSVSHPPRQNGQEMKDMSFYQTYKLIS